MRIYVTIESIGDRAFETFDGALVAHLCEAVGATSMQTFKVQRTGATLDREGLVEDSDLRSGDIVSLVVDVGGVGRAGNQRAVAATIEVLNGRQKGQQHTLRFGDNTIGRGSENDIVLDDELVSRKHASILVGDAIAITDLGSSNGVVVDGSSISRRTIIKSDSQVLIGDTYVAVHHHNAAPGLDDPSGNSVQFNRPPRVLGKPRVTSVELPIPPMDPPRQFLPKAAALVPLLMGGVMYALTQSLFSVVFIAMSPLMVLGNFFESRRAGRLNYAASVRDFEEDRDKAVATLDQAVRDEVDARFSAAPHAADLSDHVDRLSPRLWERDPIDEDFLSLRVGLAPQQSPISAKVQKGGARSLVQELEEIPPRYELLPPVPVLLPLANDAVVGIAGPDDYAEELAISLVSQIAVLHSPDEVVVSAMLGSQRAQLWDWLKWLPHTKSPLSPIKRAHVSTSVDDHHALLAQLDSVAESRGGSDYGPTPSGASPHIVLLVDDEVPLERNRFTALLERAQGADLSVIWLAGAARRLPKACRAVVDISLDGDAVEIGRVDERSVISHATFEGLDHAEAERVARKLAPVIDVSSYQSSASEVPRRVSLVDLLGGHQVMQSPAMTLERWAESSQSHSLRGPVGEGATGPLTLDMRVDGPHGLVAGTTGAGKSELLQSMLIGLAASHSPKKLTFLLVDYKGGSAFKDCVKLPHTVGLVTDLTPTLVQRALTSLRAELHHREHLLNRADAKDLVEMEELRHPDTPPSLIMVVDEFAALAREVPEFVEGVVDIAQRGRSLGIHLMLATQRPAGVITDNIRANTNLRIALRVNDKADSVDVLNDPAAADLDRKIPGRGLVRLGPSELVTFQSGYVGGVTDPEAEASLEVAAFHVDRLEPLSKVAPEPVSSNERTDLDRMVDVINAAFVNDGVAKPRRPWLDQLGEGYDVLRLPTPPNRGSLVLGVADIPERQAQELCCVDVDTLGSMLVFGAGGAGKSVTLRTIAASAVDMSDQSPVEIYGLDFAGGGLRLLAPLPHVGDIVAGEDYERVTRLLTMLEKWIDERARRYGTHNASGLEEFRRNSGEDDARIVVLLDGYENFVATFEKVDRGAWIDLLPRLVADGRSVGVNFVLTASRRNAFPLSVMSTVQNKLVLRLANPDEYSSLGVPMGSFDGKEPPGRGVFNEQMIQVAIAGQATDTKGQGAWLQAFADRYPHVPRVSEVPVLPEELPLETLGVGSNMEIRVGLDDSMQIFALEPRMTLLITAPPRGGRTTTVRTIAHAAARSGLVTRVFTGKRAVTDLPEGVRCVTGAADVVAELSVRPIASGEVIVIDELEELFDGEAEPVLQEMLSRDDIGVFAACEVSQARRGYSPTLAALKRNRRTLLLSPDPDMDGDLANARLPRTQRKFPMGRAYYSDSGRLTLLHVALTTLER